MKTAIIFSSKHGTTEKVAGILAENLGKENISLINLKKDKNPDLNAYDSVILGTAIYAGNPIKNIKSFALKNESNLKNKKVGLFICGMDPGKEKQEEQMKASFPDSLMQQAKTKHYLGGEFIFEDMNFFERFIIKKISKAEKSISLIHHENIKKFVEEFKDEENPVET
ncbi:MAG: flavodoxin [Bacteroidales bacterium]|jgi:menaquinone-dependent protoporphyrinogen oxidase|nr:flavodoxin [Bacteroidales bacterium]OQA84237.1 MAG: Protoporphyrinogen IX dehydrogenase (menaquinone) [Bacteroidetes bacterium ADurb.Bin234]